MTVSIKSFCQKRRKVVYESINKDTEEEERFSAHIEAFGHKMRAKVETVSVRISRLMSILVHPRAGPAWPAQAEAKSVCVLSDNICCKDPCRPTYRACKVDIDPRNKGETRNRLSPLGATGRRKVSVQQGLSDQWLLLEQRGPAVAGDRAQVHGACHASPSTRGSTQA